MEKPRCKLVGTDGNVFAIIGTVCRTLRKSDQKEKADEFAQKAMEQHSYGAVLRLCTEYVDVR